MSTNFQGGEPFSAVKHWKFDQWIYQTIHWLLQFVYSRGGAWN